MDTPTQTPTDPTVDTTTAPTPAEHLPLARAIDSYTRGPGGEQRQGPERLHVPGHQGGPGAPPSLRRRWGDRIWLDDLTEVPGLDDLNDPSGAIAESQALAAALLGATSAFYLVQGTTSGLVALMLAAARSRPCHTKVVLPRHSHRALVSAMVLTGLEPVFCRPASGGEGQPFGLDLAHLEELLRSHGPSLAAVCDVFPAATGLGGDLSAVTSIAHAHGLPVIADGAHAALFGFAPGMPPAPLALGADAVVVSAHKTLGSLGQSSILLLAETPWAPPAPAVAAALRLIVTTSPSYPLLLSLEAAVHHRTSPSGQRQLTAAIRAAGRAREQLKVAGVGLLDAQTSPVTFHQDPLRLVIDAWSIGLSGFAMAERLRREAHVQVEGADWRSVVVVIGPGATRVQLCRLVDGCTLIRRQRGDNQPELLGDLARARRLAELAAAVAVASPEARLTPRQAWFARNEIVPLSGAAGRVAAAALSPYPPGVPVTWPGEEISPMAREFLLSILAVGGGVHGLVAQGDEAGPTVMVPVVAPEEV